MASLAPRTLLKAARLATVLRFSPAAPFSSARRAYGSVHDNDPVVLEREKRRNLAREPYQTSAPMDEAPGWNENLATHAEANVKADRSNVDPAKLVEFTMKHQKDKQTAEDRDVEESTAEYIRDEVGGPLKNAASKVHTVIKETVKTSKAK